MTFPSVQQRLRELARRPHSLLQLLQRRQAVSIVEVVKVLSDAQLQQLTKSGHVHRPECDENGGKTPVVGLVDRCWVPIVMSLDDGTNFVGFVVHNGTMERIPNGGIVRGDVDVAFWVVDTLCFGIGFSR